jgi:hypothetical protein
VLRDDREAVHQPQVEVHRRRRVGHAFSVVERREQL